LLTTETYQNGIRNGEMKAYHPDGQIIEILNYTNDVKDGKWQQYFMNGLPKLEAVYSEGGIVRSCQIFLY
jgi:antitoxin component YwqK of YwqJK toxin-antitoxin module